MHQWQGYDELYENLAQWLKETEGKVRNESGLRPDLNSKQAQRDAFKVRSVFRRWCDSDSPVCKAQRNNIDLSVVESKLFPTSVNSYLAAHTRGHRISRRHDGLRPETSQGDLGQVIRSAHVAVRHAAENQI